MIKLIFSAHLLNSGLFLIVLKFFRPSFFCMAVDLVHNMLYSLLIVFKWLNISTLGIFKFIVIGT